MPKWDKCQPLIAVLVSLAAVAINRVEKTRHPWKDDALIVFERCVTLALLREPERASSVSLMLAFASCPCSLLASHSSLLS